MIKEIYGKKIGMTQIFDEQGDLIPLTLIEAQHVCLLELMKYSTKTKVKIGCFKIDEKKIGKVKMPVKGYFNKLKVSPYKLVREVDIEEGSDFSFLSGKAGNGTKEKAILKGNSKNLNKSSEINESEKKEVSKEEDSSGKPEEESTKEEGNIFSNSREVGIEIFKERNLVDVRSKSKGKGFAGVMKRHNFGGQPAGHGHTMHRRPGSIGPSATPSKVYKGRKMPGQMGNCFVTTRNLMVLKVDKEKNIIYLKGCIPGAKGAIVKLKKVS